MFSPFSLKHDVNVPLCCGRGGGLFVRSDYLLV